MSPGQLQRDSLINKVKMPQIYPDLLLFLLRKESDCFRNIIKARSRAAWIERVIKVNINLKKYINERAFLFRTLFGFNIEILPQKQGDFSSPCFYAR